MTQLADTLLSHPLPRSVEDGKLSVVRTPSESPSRSRSPAKSEKQTLPIRSRDRSYGTSPGLSDAEIRPVRSLSAPSMLWHHPHDAHQPENPRRFPSAPPQKRETRSSGEVDIPPLSATAMNHLGRVLQNQFGQMQDMQDDRLEPVPPTPKGRRKVKEPADLAELGTRKDFIHRLVENQCFIAGFMTLTLFALFVPDIDLLLGTVETQQILSVVMTVACFLFLFEIVVQCFGKKSYVFGAYFWLDVIALISLLPDTWLFKAVFESNQAFVAGRSSRLARLLRIASRSSKATRLNRLTRIVRVAALMPRLGKVCSKRVKVNATNRVLDKKLRRVFNFLDNDMDGLIPRIAVPSVVAKLKAGDASDEQSVALVNLMKCKVASTLGAMRRLGTKANRSEHVSEGARSKTSQRMLDFDFEPESPNPSQATSGPGPMDALPTPFSTEHQSIPPKPESSHASPRRRSPLSRAHTIQARMKVSLATSTASQLTKQTPDEEEEEDVGMIDFEAFKELMLEDKWVEEKLRRSCEQQLKQASNMKNLTSRHAEYVAVQVALGVLALLFVLNIIEPTLTNNSALRGLGFCDNLVRSEFPDIGDHAEVPELVNEQVEVWLHAMEKSIGTRSLLYLDLDKKVYCNEISSGGSCSSVQFFKGPRRVLNDLDDDVRSTGIRQVDLVLLRFPDFSDSEVSPEELELRTTAIAVIFDRARTSTEAWMSLSTTASVIVIILLGIVLLTRDLTYLSHHLLRPLRDLADDMESIAQFAGVGSEEEAGGEPETSEVLLIRRTFDNMKKAVRSWGKYVPLPVVQLLLRDGEEAKLEVKEREVTMFFSDIANFTTIVESIEPAACLLLLSRYFNDMSKVIDEHSGVVLEFIGDAIQCVYGAPLENERHPTLAVEAALRMLGALRRIRDWCKEHRLPEVNIRCGVHTGRVLVGNMGFSSRMKYGIVGEESTIAGKLEELNKTYKTRILISESTYELLDPNEFFIRPVDFTYLRQVQEATSELVYEVMPMKTKKPSSPLKRILSLHAEGICEYRRREFSSAARKFEQVNTILADFNGEDDVPSSLMAKRCTTLAEVPPSNEWDGTWDSYVDSLGV
ncbi:cya1 [Symbiodinium natans]|uniref:Cya1 protein n=1 Tax=Symbiodinium natans TaxID=878477 RepID=A0A812IJQ8_9DINO|nr:cya1 [Symbiodinium natans]